MSGEHVLVTGGSGFLGTHCVARLLDDRYRVSTTVRTPGRADQVRAVLAGNSSNSDRAGDVRFITADLTKDEGWDEAVAGVDYVLHVASPFPAAPPAHEDDLILPARNGALRVLRAARRAGVRRVVLTSSFAAIGYGHAPTDVPYDETTWTDVDAPGVTAYAKSKTLAERAAWDFVERYDMLELAVVNPTGILGPVLGPDDGTSVAVVANLLYGKLPLLPRASAGIVDVRDIADLHVRAMTDAKAAGERFLGTAGLMSLSDMAATLKQGLGAEARRVSTRTIPDWVVRLAARFDDNARQAVPMIGRPHRATSAKAEKLLGWTPRPKEEAVLATGRSILARAH
ncbi:nucleoside-diphosphate-sugar epimerase [Catenulispora sp. GAS73]|uniref:NAD-dependent epimerase/dehydratase family protein n=1 Tax=Catenulispora sp. GAS73 TaxID=3156269 RepID=UPI0035146FC1